MPTVSSDDRQAHERARDRAAGRRPHPESPAHPPPEQRRRAPRFPRTPAEAKSWTPRRTSKRG